MNFLLKIVRGPNTGAEIALVEGLAVSVGKDAACDILLADPTLPDEPLQLETAADSVVLVSPAGREHLTPFHVVSFGSTSFAVGPADAAWKPLVWPDEGKPEAAPAAPAGETPPSSPAPPDGIAPPPPPKKRSLRFLAVAAGAGALLLLLLLLLLFRGCGGESGEEGGRKGFFHRRAPAAGADGEEQREAAFKGLAEKYSLTEGKKRGKTVYVRNFATRAERLAAMGEIYAVRPGVPLDFSDDESFATAAEDLVFTLTEGSLSVAEATNRVLVLSGTAADPASLSQILESLSRDLPHLERVVCDNVRWANGLIQEEPAEPDEGGEVEEPLPQPLPAPVPVAAPAAPKRPAYPVCGILTTPYPCIVLQNGKRILEGGVLDDATVLKIEADRITLSTPAGRMVWRP